MEFCQWETFSAKCQPGKVILLENANYGRMGYGRCIEQDFGYVGCSKDVLQLTDLRCSGRESCSIRIPDEHFDALKPCPNDLRRYFSVKFKCIPYFKPKSKNCDSKGHVHVNVGDGYLASIVTQSFGCGGTDKPWLLEAEIGQKINLTLYDFGISAQNYSTTIEKKAFPHCHVYMIIKERDTNKSTTICGGATRIYNAYISTSNKVEIRVMTGQPTKNKMFLLHYEAIGCPRVSAPVKGWMEKIENKKYRIGCNEHSSYWTITCNGTQWDKTITNCSNIGPVSNYVMGHTSLPYALSLAIIVGIALLIGLCILVMGLLVLKRQRRLRSTKTPGKVLDKSKFYREEMYSKVLHDNNVNGYRAHSESSLENEYAYVEDLLPPQPPPILVPNTKACDIVTDSLLTPAHNHYEYAHDTNSAYPYIPDYNFSYPYDRQHRNDYFDDAYRDSRHYFELNSEIDCISHIYKRKEDLRNQNTIRLPPIPSFSDCNNSSNNRLINFTGPI